MTCWIPSTVILLVLGTEVGLSLVSPWYGAGASAATVGVSAVVWLIVVQWISSGLGGFLAGRLRIKWVRVHTHEVFFRDTAHGFLAWSLASLAGALMFASVTASGVSGVAKGTLDIPAAAASRAAQAGVQNGHAGAGDGSAYFVDTMFLDGLCRRRQGRFPRGGNAYPGQQHAGWSGSTLTH
jgi:hypothetical protein